MARLIQARLQIVVNADKPDRLAALKLDVANTAGVQPHFNEHEMLPMRERAALLMLMQRILQRCDAVVAPLTEANVVAPNGKPIRRGGS